MRKLYILFIVLMYCLCGVFLTAIINDALMDFLVNVFVFLGIGLIVLMGLISLLVLLLNKRLNCDFKFIRNVKISLIPFYIFFGVIGALLMLGLLVPFLWLVVIVSIIVGFVFGYFSIIVTGLPNILKLFKTILFDKNHSIILIIALICHFFFVLDIVGSILVCIYNTENKLEGEVL